MQISPNKIAKYSIIAIIILFLSIKPYNWFCATSEKCQIFNLSGFIPREEGNTQVNVTLETRSPYKDIKFEVVGEDLITPISGKKIVVKYRVQNLTNSTIIFRPKLYIKPKEFEEYIEREECLCYQEYKLKKGEEKILQASFILQKGFFDYKYSSFYENPEQIVTIGYSLR